MRIARKLGLPKTNLDVLILLLGFTVGLSGASQVLDVSHGKAGEVYQAGMRLLNEKRYHEALEQFRLVEQYAPELPQGPSGEGIALALMGKPKEAVQALKKALTIDPDFWLARRELGIVYWSQGLKNLAGEELEPIIKLHPDDGPVNAILGQYQFEQKNYSQALVYLSRVPGQVAADPSLSLLKVEALLKTGQTAQATEALKGLAGRVGLTEGQSFQVAWLLGQAKLFKPAIEAFKELTADYPDGFRHHYGLALAYFGDGQYDACISTLKALLEHGDTHPELFGLLGVAEEKSGHTEEAYDAFRQGILRNPGDPQNYLNIATLACEHLSYDLAARILTAGIEKIPHSHELFLSRGIVYTLKAEFSLARQDCEHAIQLAPADPGSYLVLGLSQLEAGGLDGAVRSFDEASIRAPKDFRPYYFLTEALIQKGSTLASAEFDRARRAIDTALSLDPDFAYAYRDRAKLELQAKEAEKAIADLERARALDPQSSSIAYLLAQAYRLKGEKAKANELFALVKESSEQEAQRFRQGELTQALIVLSRGSQ